MHQRIERCHQGSRLTLSPTRPSLYQTNPAAILCGPPPVSCLALVPAYFVGKWIRPDTRPVARAEGMRCLAPRPAAGTLPPCNSSRQCSCRRPGCRGSEPRQTTTSSACPPTCCPTRWSRPTAPASPRRTVAGHPAPRAAAAVRDRGVRSNAGERRADGREHDRNGPRGARRARHAQAGDARVRHPGRTARPCTC